MEGQLDEGFLRARLVGDRRRRTDSGAYAAHLLMDVELAEDFGGVQEVGVLDDPVRGRLVSIRGRAKDLRQYGEQGRSLLLDVVSEERQVQD